MTRVLCARVRPLLGSLVDGELSGADMLRVTAHLGECHACAGEFDALRRIGDLLRTTATSTEIPSMAGLADGLITRVRAESEQSWRGLFQRAVDSWHWTIVGLGSVTATAVVTLIVSAVLMFGPAPNRSDSLAGVLSEFDPSQLQQHQTLFVVWNGRDLDGMLHHVATGGAMANDPFGGGVIRASFVGPTERELVIWLSEALSREGSYDLSRMGEGDQRYVEGLMDRINRIRTSTREVKLMSVTTVKASGP